LEYPQYTRPREYAGLSVPDVLLSGNHAEIEAWRRAQSEERTRRRRPDLLQDSAAGFAIEAQSDARRSGDVADARVTPSSLRRAVSPPRRVASSLVANFAPAGGAAAAPRRK